MKKIILLIPVLLHMQFSRAQHPLVKQWDSRFGGILGDKLSCFHPASDGGFILGGFSKSGVGGDKSTAAKGNWDYWLVKTDAAGNKIWDKTFGGTGDDELYSLCQTRDQGYLLGGFSRSGVSGDKTQNNRDSTGNTADYWILKTDSLGNLEWDKVFGGTGSDMLFTLQQTRDGGYLLGGLSYSGINGDKTQPALDTSNLTSDYWLVKTDSLGNASWDRVYGGFQEDRLTALQQTRDGGFLLGGYSRSQAGGDKSQANWDSSGNSSDYWVLKTDSSGNKLWDKNFGGTLDDQLASLQQTHDGGSILAGISISGAGGDKTQASQGNRDFWMVKLDSAGMKQWDRDYGGTGNDDLMGNVFQTKEKGFLVTGTSYSNQGGDKTENNLGMEQIWVLKTDSLGLKEWDKTVLTNGHDETGLTCSTPDGGYVFANYTSAGIGGEKSQDCRGGYDFWMIKYEDTATTISPVQIACSDTVFCGKQCIDFYDLSTNSPTSWQWSFPGAVPATSNQQNPVGICYNSFGSFDVSLKACSASGCDSLTLQGFIIEFQNPPIPVISLHDDTLQCTPAFAYQWYLNSGILPGATNSWHVIQQSGNYFVIVTDSNGCAASSWSFITGTPGEIFFNEFIAGPGPGGNDLILTGGHAGMVVSAYDLAGHLVLKGKLAGPQETWRWPAPSGVYVLEVQDEQYKIRRKLIWMK